MYSVKEIYYTLQGEGFHTGKPAIFLRFSGCNLWTGLEKDRAKAICQFCDTDFWGTDGMNGGKYSARDLSAKCLELWPKIDQTELFVVCTGGEPLLQLDEELIADLHDNGFTVAIESNGTLPVPKGIDWVCISPKAGAYLVVKSGNELKLVYPQKGSNPKDFEDLDFEHFFLQPMDNTDQQSNITTCVAYCKDHPKWRLSLQTHKLIGIP